MILYHSLNVEYSWTVEKFFLSLSIKKERQRDEDTRNRKGLSVCLRDIKITKHRGENKPLSHSRHRVYVSNSEAYIYISQSNNIRHVHIKDRGEMY